MDVQVIYYIVAGSVALIGFLGSLLAPLVNKVKGNIIVKNAFKWAQIGVRSAEQVFGAGTGEQKKTFVIDFLKKKLKLKGLNDTQLDSIIEAAVYEVSGAVKTQKEVAKITATGKATTSIGKDGLTIIKEGKQTLEDVKESTNIQTF